MRYLHFLTLGLFLGHLSCSLLRGTQASMAALQTRGIQVIGHRGDPWKYPENSVPGFLSAVQKGVQVLEMDVVISADHKVVVSHEPYMAAHRVLDPQGVPVSKQDQMDHNLFLMSYDSIKKYRYGTIRNKKWPDQSAIPVYKPLLEEVILSVEGYRRNWNLPPVKYLIEIKSDPRYYEVYQPGPELFADLVMEVVRTQKIQDRCIISSFDPMLLAIVHEKYPTVPISYLVSGKEIDSKLSALGFLPNVYSIHFRAIRSKKQVQRYQDLNIKVHAWTVNRRRHIRKMVRYGVDGIITDHPRRVQVLLGRKSTLTL